MVDESYLLGRGRELGHGRYARVEEVGMRERIELMHENRSAPKLRMSPPTPARRWPCDRPAAAPGTGQDVQIFAGAAAEYYKPFPRRRPSAPDAFKMFARVVHAT